MLRNLQGWIGSKTNQKMKTEKGYLMGKFFKLNNNLSSTLFSLSIHKVSIACYVTHRKNRTTFSLYSVLGWSLEKKLSANQMEALVVLILEQDLKERTLSTSPLSPLNHILMHN